MFALRGDTVALTSSHGIQDVPKRVNNVIQYNYYLFYCISMNNFLKLLLNYDTPPEHAENCSARFLCTR